MRRDKRNSPVRQPRIDPEEQSFVFRRSRTITGSSASAVRASAEDNSQLRSPRLHEHSLRKHRRRLTAYLIICLFAAGSLLYVVSSFITAPTTIQTFTAQPTTAPLDQAHYTELTNTYLENHPFERFDFAFDQTSFASFMSQQAPELKDARLSSGSWFAPAELRVSIRQPIASWQIAQSTYFVDADGVAFERNYFAAPTITVSDKSGLGADAGVIASGKLLRFIGRLVTVINQSPVYKVDTVTLPANSTRQVDVKLKGKSYVIKTNIDRDPAGQAVDVINAVAYMDSKKIIPSYIDVRVSSKAFYRQT